MDGPGGDRPRRPMPAIAAVAVRPVRVPPGGLADDEGGGGDAPPVRRSRGHQGGQGRGREAGRRARRPSLADRLPVVPEVELPLEPGVDCSSAPTARARPTWSRRSATSRRGFAPGRHDAPLVRTGAERAVVRANVRRDDREPLVELEIEPGRANRARLNRSPLPRARDALGVLRTVVFAPEDLALVKGDPPSAGASSTSCWCCARRGWPASARTTSACSSSATRCSSPPAAASARGRRRPATLDVWDAHLAAAGAAAGGPARPGRRAAPAGGQGVRVGGRTRGPPTAGRHRLPQLARPGRRRRRRRPRAALPRRIASRAGRVRRQELERGISLVGRTVTTSGSSSAAARRRGTRATASPGRTRWRCGWPATTCCPATRGDGEPVLVLDDVFAELDTSAGPSWPRGPRGPTRCWSPPRCPRTCRRARRRAVRGVGGEVRRVTMTGEEPPTAPRPYAAAWSSRRRGAGRRQAEARPARAAQRRRGPRRPRRRAPGSDVAPRRRRRRPAQRRPARTSGTRSRSPPPSTGSRRARLGGRPRPRGAGPLAGLVGPSSPRTASRSFADGVLMIRAESTAWATQLRLLAPTLVGRLNAGRGRHGHRVAVRGPARRAGRAARSVRGRGPRDTYG